MAAITAAAVAQLREKTGAGMMQCKQALTEADGNLEEAVIILRKKLGNKVGQREGRKAAEGIIEGAISADKKRGVLVELNSETDFVARNDDFKALAQEIVQKILAYEAGTVPTDVAALLADGGLGERITEAAGRIGEKVVLGRFERFGAPEGNVVGMYIHNPGGKIGVLVEATGADEAALTTLTREVALHIASANPQYLNESEVEPGILEREREIARAQAANDPKMAGKPEKALESMVNGRVRKFLEETVLLNQAYVRDPAKTIAQVVAETSGASLVRFARFRVGETVADTPEGDEA